MARRHSGTRCSRFAFIRAAGTVHTWSVVSISAHRAPRTSPHRCGSQHEELERQLDRLRRVRGPDGRDRRRHVPVRQRSHVPDDL